MDLNRAVRLPVSVLGIGLFALTLFFAVEWGERPARGRDAGGDTTAFQTEHGRWDGYRTERARIGDSEGETGQCG